jgi:DNA-binding PadR family transcriptional regulator
MVQRGRIFAWAGESQYYVEPKRLARLGYLAPHKEPGKTRERTVYTLTEKGLDAMRAWADAPLRFTPLKSEPLVRMLMADLVGEAPTREGIVSMREDIADLLARLDDAAANAELLPHRRKYLLLTNSLVRGLLELHLDWIDEVERELREP